jgi:GT2 family glycosyltransferase
MIALAISEMLRRETAQDYRSALVEPDLRAIKHALFGSKKHTFFMRISVCIGTYNRADLLIKTLESVRSSTYPHDNMEVIVIDNNSTDATKHVAESASSWFPHFKYLFEKRQGLSYARNAGIRASAGEIICFLDDDTTIDRNYFTAVDDVFSRYDCAGVGSRIIPEWNCPKPTSFATEGPYNVSDGFLVRFDKGDNEEELTRSWFGAGMSIRRSALERHGLFAEHLSRVGRTEGMGEDSEIFHRLKAAGELLFYAPKAVVSHPVDAERLTKTFVRKWHFEHGRFLALVDLQNYRSLNAVPLWTVKKSFLHVARFLGAGGTWERAYHEASLWEIFGTIRGYRQRNSSTARGSTSGLTKESKPS